MCTCVSTDKVSILIIVLHSHVISNALVVTKFKICLQFDFIWWNSPSVSASTGVLSAAVLSRRKGNSQTTNHVRYIADNIPLKTFNKIKRKFRLCEL
jgi:hypothetical protein